MRQRRPEGLERVSLCIRIPRWVMEIVREEAKRRGISMTHLVITALIREVGGEERDPVISGKLTVS